MKLQAAPPLAISPLAAAATRSVLVAVAVLLAAAGGCSSSARDRGWSGPQQPVMLSTEGWTYDGRPARKIRTPHYVLNTTITDDRFVETTAQVMEGAYDEYRKLVPGLPLSDRPMDCYLFATRPEWEQFTRKHTGSAARVYLQIMRGGYAVRDWYVSYYMGDYSTYSVAAHEGWHQFCGRHFKGKLPPFLEEGIACLFEGVSLSGPRGLPRWNSSVNLNRAVKLRQAVLERRMWPLDKLVTMHAGQIVNERPEQIDAFYAQNWAFARFCWEEAKYRPGLQRLLTETASGTIFDPAAGRPRPAGWIPAATAGILEHYLGTPFQQIEKDYLAFVNRIAFEQFEAQWQS